MGANPWPRAFGVDRFTDPALGNDSYLFGAADRAVVIDPIRDVRAYLEAAETRGSRIEVVLETHLHADFVSGAGELAMRGARVIASKAAGLSSPHEPVTDGDEIDAGGTRLVALATPGHTPEHVAYLIADADPPVLFSGGALMPGGAARTDLLGPERTDELARELFHTLHERLAKLPDETIVHPTHGAGSLCSSGAATVGRSTTLGAERRDNPLLAAASEEEFIELLISRYGPYPPYFLRLRELNRAGAELLSDGPRPEQLSVPRARWDLSTGAIAVDVRPVRRFAEGHLSGSVSVSLEGSFLVWLGWIVPWDARFLLIADSEAEAQEAAWRSARIGFEPAGWARFDELAASGHPVAETELIDADELERRLAEPDSPRVVDVRRPGELAVGMVPAATNEELGRLASGLPPDLTGPVVTYCASGARAAVAASLLERAGVGPVAIYPGGVSEWRESGRPLEPA